MLIKIVCIITVARVLDSLILFFSRRMKKGQLAARLLLFMLVSIGVIISLVGDFPATKKEVKASGLQLVATRFSKGLGQATSKPQAVAIVKVPYLTDKKMLVIGDSITELDGRAVPKIGKITGYQESFREQGAHVTTYGFGGATYSLKDTKITKVNHRSLYDKVVTDKLDVTKVDIVTLFAGTNDVGLGYPVGSSDKLEVKTAVGGLKAILDYLKKNNPHVQIFIFTPIKRVGEKYDQNLTKLSAEIVKVGKAYTLPVCELFLTSGITLANQQDFLYDGLHPNSQGMALIGEEMTTFIEENQHSQK